MKNSMKPLAFVLKLRGLAASLVLCSHHLHYFWFNQEFCGHLANQSPVKLHFPLANFLEKLPIDLGNFGVAVFFLISGFLMPLTAQNSDATTFICKRIRRIWPAYIIAFLLTLLVIILTSWHRPQTIPWSFDHLLASIFLLRDIFDYPFIDGIVWTLEIEIKFYLLCWLAYRWLQSAPLKFLCLLLGLALLSFLLLELRPLLVSNDRIDQLVVLFFIDMKFICFIGLGACLSFFYQQKLRSKTAAIYFISLASLYGAYFFYMPKSKELVSYLIGLILFISCYYARRYFTMRGIWSYLGNISYSLYLTHGVPGFALLYWFLAAGLSAGYAVSLVFLYAFIVANLFYWLVERRICTHLPQAIS